MTRSRTTQLVRRTAIALAACALVPASAQARVASGWQSTDQAQPSAVSQNSHVIALRAAHTGAGQPIVIRRSRLVLQPDGTVTGPAPTPASKPVVVATGVPSAEGFDKADLGIAAAAAALLLVVAVRVRPRRGGLAAAA